MIGQAGDTRSELHRLAHHHCVGFGPVCEPKVRFTRENHYLAKYLAGSQELSGRAQHQTVLTSGAHRHRTFTGDGRHRGGCSEHRDNRLLTHRDCTQCDR